MKAGYKSLITKLRELLSSHRATWHGITSLAVSIFENADLRADAGLTDDYKTAEWMDREFGFVEECGLGFLQLRAIIQRFPAAEQWRTKPLGVLHDEALAQAAGTRKEDAEPATRRKATLKDVEERDRKIEDLEYRVKYADEKAEDAAKSLAELKAEVQDLRTENRQLRAENVELRKQLAAMPVPAA